MKPFFQSYKKKGDNELPDLVRNGNRNKAMAEIYRRFGHLVFGLCLKYLKNKQDAEDLTMDIFTDLENRILKHEISYFKSWLYQLSKNECLMKLRKSKTFQEDILSSEVPHNDSELQVKIDTEQKIEALQKAISYLKEEQRKALVLFFLHKKSYQEISEEMNLPLSKVKSAIQNGKRNLKINLQENELFKTI